VFAWELFRWMNPADGEAPWQSWAALPIVTKQSCRAPGDLSAFANPPTDADCATQPARPPDFNPLVDINGNPVELEARVDPLTQERLAGAEDELQAFCAGDTQSNSWSDALSSTTPSPMRIKIAWKQVVAQDCKLGRRFLMKQTMRIGCEAGQQGMVAMHIALKTFCGGFAWTWASFSHRDNLASSNPMFEPCGDDDPWCNRCPASPTEPTHLRRLHAIPPRIAALNTINALRSGPDQYLLLGVQRRFETWAPAPTLARPDVFASEIIEWDRQNTSCIGCHGKALVLSPPGSDDQATTCCSHLEAKDCQGPQLYLRCSTDPPVSGGPALTADYFMGLTAWYQTFNMTSRISHD
jgi:hypothetical protein